MRAAGRPASLGGAGGRRCAAGRGREGAAARTSCAAPARPRRGGWKRASRRPHGSGPPASLDAPGPAVRLPAAFMDAALKRSRSEEPAELVPSARGAEAAAEEGMEQGLEEEEEEVDPRIQVGARSARAPQRPVPAGGGGRLVPGAGRGSESRFIRPWGGAWARPDCTVWSPRTRARMWGSPQRARWLGRRSNKGRRGRGRRAGVGVPPGGAGPARGARWALSVPQRGRTPEPWVPCPHLAEVPGQAVFLLLAHGRAYCHGLSAVLGLK